MESIEDAVRHILHCVGEDPQREGLLDTPERVAKAYRFLTEGYRQTLDEIVHNALFESPGDEMIIVKDIEVFSLCEHHMLPFYGKAHVGYIPNGKVLGVSKVARIVDMYARRLQLQERLTEQVANALQKAVQPKGVGVIMEAQHLCMMMRGVEKQNSVMTTSAMRGAFRERGPTRAEFIDLVKK